MNLSHGLCHCCFKLCFLKAVSQRTWLNYSDNLFKHFTNFRNVSCVVGGFFMTLLCLLFFLFSFLDRVILCSLGCPETHSVDQAGLELRNQPAFASQVLGLKACTTITRLYVYSYCLSPMEGFLFNTYSV